MVRDDLAPGPQLAQTAHAAFAFAMKYPRFTRGWHDVSQYLVVLSVPSENALEALADQLQLTGLRAVRVHEPDYGDQLTAIAVEPAARRSLSSLPLAGRQLV